MSFTSKEIAPLHFNFFKKTVRLPEVDFEKHSMLQQIESSASCTAQTRTRARHYIGVELSFESVVFVKTKSIFYRLETFQKWNLSALLYLHQLLAKILTLKQSDEGFGRILQALGNGFPVFDFSFAHPLR